MSAPTQFLYKDLGANARSQQVEELPSCESLASTKGSVAQSRPVNFTSWVSESGEETEPEHLYTAEEIAEAVDDARRAASAETEARLRAELAGEIEQRRCEILATLSHQLEEQKSTFDNELVRYAVVSQRLAVMLARAAIPRALENYPFADITELLKASMMRLASEPSIELRLSPNLIESGEAILADMAREVGFVGEFEVVADPALGSGDVELRWQGSKIDCRVDRLYAETLAIANQWLNDDVDKPSESGESLSAASRDQEVLSSESKPVKDASLQAE